MNYSTEILIKFENVQERWWQRLFLNTLMQRRSQTRKVSQMFLR